MRHTALIGIHKKLGAKLTGFHGWEMPLEYTGTLKEHEAVRSAAGLFDVGHMGVIEVGGKDSIALLARVLTFRPDTLPVDNARYGFILNEKGGIIDDLMAFRLNDERFLLVVNAAAADKDLAWLKAHAKGFDAVLIDDSPDTAIIAIQGPASWDIVSDALGIDPKGFKYHSFTNSKLGGTGFILSKTGYTGEKGFEVLIHNKAAGLMWEALMAAGAGRGLMPCGLGARDTLRLEMGYLLNGADADEDTNPIEAGYGWAVDFDNEGFIGRAALVKSRDEGPAKSLKGLALTSKAVPREGCVVVAGGEQVGTVTSGNFSPMLKKGIALAYLKAGSPRTGLSIVIRDKSHEAEVVELPFYKRK